MIAMAHRAGAVDGAKLAGPQELEVRAARAKNGTLPMGRGVAAVVQVERHQPVMLWRAPLVVPAGYMAEEAVAAAFRIIALRIAAQAGMARRASSLSPIRRVAAALLFECVLSSA